MAHKGAAPLDPTTPVGRLRTLLRDTQYTPLSPPQEGFGDYAVYSDVDLEIYLIDAGENVYRAAGAAIKSLAIQYSAEGKSIKSDDLAVDLRSRGKDLLEVARSFIEDANAEDAAEAADYFNVVPFGDNPFSGCRCPEGAICARSCAW